MIYNTKLSTAGEHLEYFDCYFRRYKNKNDAKRFMILIKKKKSLFPEDL